MTETARLAQLLASRLRAVWGAAAEITGIQRLPGGASRESWGVQARMADGAEHRLILLRDPMAGLRRRRRHPPGRGHPAVVGAVRHRAVGSAVPSSRPRGTSRTPSLRSSSPCSAAAYASRNTTSWLALGHAAPLSGRGPRWTDTVGRDDGVSRAVSTPAGFTVKEYLWTFNMPTDHAHVSLTGVRVPDAAILGGEGRGLAVVQHFFNENRIRQAASSLGAAQFCIDRSVAYAKTRAPFGQPLASNQAIQFPLVELQTQCEMLRALIHKTAWGMDQYGPLSQSDKVPMCNFVANRLCCDAADRAMKQQAPKGVPETPADRSGA